MNKAIHPFVSCWSRRNRQVALAPYRLLSPQCAARIRRRILRTLSARLDPNRRSRLPALPRERDRLAPRPDWAERDAGWRRPPGAENAA